MNGTEDLKVSYYPNPDTWYVTSLENIAISPFYDTKEQAQAVLDSWRNADKGIAIRTILIEYSNELSVQTDGAWFNEDDVDDFLNSRKI